MPVGLHCHLLENPAFMRWFGMSQVRDEDGCPLVVYHGTQKQERWCVWDRKGAAQWRPKKCLDFVGSWFADSYELGRIFSGQGGRNPSRPSDLPIGRIEAVFLKIEFPFIVGGKMIFDAMVDAADAWPRQGRKIMQGKMYGIDHDRIRRWLKEMGFDGLWIKDAHLHWDQFDIPGRYDYWVPLEPNQIKSISNKGTWRADRKSYLDGF
jgi:hypothetical protein